MQNGETFFSSLRDLYEGRVFAFNHFTMSQSPEENARELLKSIPDGRTLFDVITHSRGGLVLRYLAGPPDALDGLADKFRLGRAVIVAAPNEGTPLASPGQFEHFLTWFANLLEICPSTPFATALDLIIGGLSWLAQHVDGIVPGIAAMDSEGEVVTELRNQLFSPAGALSALVSNFEADKNLMLRIADAGLNLLFPSANDFVVPTEGGWRVENAIPGERIGCFGPGGNLAGSVMHTDFFTQPATIDFLVRALRGVSQELAWIDPAKEIPRHPWRGTASTTVPETAGRETHASQPRTEQRQPTLQGQLPEADKPSIPSAGAGQVAIPWSPVFSAETLYLSVLPVTDTSEYLYLLATFRNAQVTERVTSPILVSPPEGSVGAVYDRICKYLDGDTNVESLPKGKELLDFGSALFDLLFPGDVRRLYDAARAAQGSRRLQVVFTSAVDELAVLPWEFAFDRTRRVFLATEEVNFVRNVWTAFPADQIEPRHGRLRILVVVAQPLNLARLSAQEETDAIMEGFRYLRDSGLAEVEVLLDATPATLHTRLLSAPSPFDVLHFIGHGEFDTDSNLGRLAFEDRAGGISPLESVKVHQVVCRRDLRLVFLNACETGRGASLDFTRGVAPDLIANGIPAVVANQFSVLDASATLFARHFYWSLAEGRAIGDAAREARVAVNYSIPGENIDWAVPVLFARNPGDSLVVPQPGTSILKPQPMSPPRRRVLRRSTRVALWDMHRSLPQLDLLAEQMTSAQDEFGFESVPVSVPLGTWRRGGKDEGVYFDPKGVEKVLNEKADDLKVAFVLCITYLRMRGDLFIRRLRKVCIVSTHAFRNEFDPPRTSLTRLIVNAAAYRLTELDPHDQGPKNCICYYNYELDIDSAAGPVVICENCRDKLRDKGHTLDAIDALLRAFS